MRSHWRSDTFSPDGGLRASGPARSRDYGQARLSLTLLSLLGRLSECDQRGEAALQARELAIDLDISPGRVSRHLATLEVAGLLIRRHNAEDGRGLDVELTDTGRARLAAARLTELEIVERDFLAHITPSEMAVLAGIATKILQALDTKDA